MLTRFWKKLFEDNFEKCEHTAMETIFNGKEVTATLTNSHSILPSTSEEVEYVYCDCASKECQLKVEVDGKERTEWKDCNNVLKTGKRKCTSGLKLFQKCNYDVCRQCVRYESVIVLLVHILYVCIDE